MLSRDKPAYTERPYRTTFWSLYGFALVSLSIPMYLVGVAIAPFRRLLVPESDNLLRLNELVVWYSGAPLVLGAILIVTDFLLFGRIFRQRRQLRNTKSANRRITVALTAYNDESSIEASVRDFLSQPIVARVVVISNNSSDETVSRARRAGAIVFNETTQGYGPCVHRALTEALRFEDTEMTVLCEGDQTFRAYDLEKLMAFSEHADIVVGTRIVERLQDGVTQLSTFMHYGNLFVGKLLEFKYLSQVTLTDVGTTYKLCHNSFLRDFLSREHPYVNLEFNAYFLDKALSMGRVIVECPITFHRRVGVSKGGNSSNLAALRVGICMIFGILCDWRHAKGRIR